MFIPLFLVEAASVITVLKLDLAVVAMVWLLFCGLMVSGVEAGPRWRGRGPEVPWAESD